jgi:hypothetical protein
MAVLKSRKNTKKKKNWALIFSQKHLKNFTYFLNNDKNYKKIKETTMYTFIKINS